MGPKDLNLAVLQCAAACLRAGDWATLRELGFGRPEIDAVRSLTLDQLDRLADHGRGHVLRVRLDRRAFWALVDEIRLERGREDVQIELLRRDAPQDMMEALFGIGPKRYARLRRGLEVPQATGRPAEPSEDEARRVWQAWEALGERTDLEPHEWLALCERAGVNARACWRLLVRWTTRETSTARTAVNLETAP